MTVTIPEAFASSSGKNGDRPDIEPNPATLTAGVGGMTLTSGTSALFEQLEMMLAVGPPNERLSGRPPNVLAPMESLEDY